MVMEKVQPSIYWIKSQIWRVRPRSLSCIGQFYAQASWFLFRVSDFEKLNWHSLFKNFAT